jgi:phosphate ABC transporter phosphate-binding protein
MAADAQARQPPSPSGANPPTIQPRLDTLSVAQETASGPNTFPSQLIPGAEPAPGYRLVRPLGKGSFGEVWEALGPGDFPVALKFVQLAGAVSNAELRSLELIKNLRHPNLLALHGAWERDNLLILAMELADGTLLDHLHQAVGEKQLAGIPLPELLRHMGDAARGLDYLNAHGVQHRDVKPHNLMLVGGGVKVGDFGLVKLLQQTLASASGSMTPAYASPEACNDRVSRWSDQYSLAVTYCHLRGNRLPFEGSVAAILAGHLMETPNLEMIPSAEERQVVARALAKKAEERWPDCAAFVAALASCGTVSASALPVRPTSHPLPAQAPAPDKSVQPVADRSEAKVPGSPRASHGLIVLAAALAGGLIIGALIWWPLSHHQSGAKESPTAQAKQSAAQAESSADQPKPGAATATNESNVINQQAKPSGSQPKSAETVAKPGAIAGTVIHGGGSTFVSPLMQHWAGIYEKEHGVHIEYQAVGFEGGLGGVLKGDYSFGCTDGSLSDQQIADAKKAGHNVVHVPLVLGAVVPAYNLPGVGSGPLHFTGPVLADIYLGKITRWNHPALKAANPGIVLPDLAITPVHRADGSDTTYVWTDYLSSVSGEWKSRFGAAIKPNWPGGLEGTRNHGVASKISRTIGSIGYVELSYALENNLHFGQVKNHDGKFVTANLESVRAAADAPTNIPADLRLHLIDAPGHDTYPIVRMSYALIYADQNGNPYGSELISFLHWATHEGQTYVKDLPYAPLPPELVQHIDAALDTLKLK